NNYTTTSPHNQPASRTTKSQMVRCSPSEPSVEIRFCRNCLCFSNRWLLIRPSNHSPCGENASRAVADWIVSRSRCVAHGCTADSEVRSSLGLCDHSPARPEQAEETANRNEDAAAHVRSSYKLNRFRTLAPLAALHLCQSFSLFRVATGVGSQRVK